MFLIAKESCYKTNRDGIGRQLLIWLENVPNKKGQVTGNLRNSSPNVVISLRLLEDSF